jgi:hypothetical protein
MRGVLIVRSRERPKPCSEVSATARHELGDLKGDMVRDTRCTKRSPHR